MSLVKTAGAKIPLLKTTEMGVEKHTVLKHIVSVSYNDTNNETVVRTVDGQVMIIKTSNEVLYAAILVQLQSG